MHETHPDSGFRIADFQLPYMEEVRAFIDEVARVVPQVQYVGWDIVVSPDGPVLVEGNWGAGVYENKPSVTRHPHGPQASLPRGHRLLRSTKKAPDAEHPGPSSWI